MLLRNLFGFVFCFLFWASASAQEVVLTTHQVCGLKTVQQVFVDKSGQHIAYVVSIPRDALQEDGRARSELWLTTKDGGAGKLFMKGPFSKVTWSSDGSRLFFIAQRGEDKVACLYAISKTGGEAQRVFTPRASIRYYTVSPDGKRVAYVCHVPVKEGQWESRGFDQFAYGESTHNVQLREVELSSMNDGQIPHKGAPWEVSYSPDGKSLAFWQSPSPTTDDRYMARSLWVFRRGTDSPVEVAPNSGKVGVFRWGPNSRRIAFISGVDVHDPKEGVLRLVTLPSSPKKFAVKTLTPSNFLGHVADMMWVMGKDKKDAFALLVNQGMSSFVMGQSASGGPMKKMVEFEETSSAPVVWRSLSIHQNEKGDWQFIALAESPKHPKELYVNGTRVTYSNKSVLSESKKLRLGRQEEVHYVARDGIEIGGILIYPVGYEKGKRYPLICMIHGGPESHYANAWLSAYSMPGQVAAGKGYFVFHPNYRSSTGRGVAFSKLGQGQSAHGEFDDIVDGVDHLVELGFVDKNRVGITGGSYGGYASAWGATYYSNRFAASVMFVGISEQISKVFTTDIPNESFLVHWRMRPWGNWQRFLEASPLYYIDRAHTPILIMHGEKDPRVPVAQSIELYRALKIKGGVPSRLVLYPREQHGNRNAAARLDYGLRQMRWFDHFLKDQGKDLPPFQVDYDKKN